MTPFVTVVDEFLPNAAEVREYALTLNYEPKEYTGFTYHGIGLSDMAEASILPLIERVVGAPIKKKLSFFKLAGDNDPSPTFIHADVSTDAKFAAILYLSDPTGPMQGTAFWRHKEFAADRIPRLPEAIRAEWLQKNGAQLNTEAGDETKWTQTGLLGQRFNRFAIYPTDYFHSRWPRETTGSTKAASRLTWVAFFDIDQPGA